MTIFKPMGKLENRQGRLHILAAREEKDLIAQIDKLIADNPGKTICYMDLVKPVSGSTVFKNYACSPVKYRMWQLDGYVRFDACVWVENA
ncbi:hypothetical protein [Novosphingobium sp.]|uniref:hypothetical protein n=1 Tax=Novosphingobium sp. TaxID=1874826 RepID=UPI0035654C5B